MSVKFQLDPRGHFRFNITVSSNVYDCHEQEIQSAQICAHCVWPTPLAPEKLQPLMP